MRRVWPNTAIRRVAVVTIAAVLVTAGAGAQEAAKEQNKAAAIAGTLLQVAAMNYTGPHQQLAHSLVTLFNGGDVSAQQSRYDPNDPYGVYPGDDDLGYEDPGAGASDASAYDDYQEPGYYPAGTPSIDAALIGRAADGSLQLLENGVTLHGPAGGSSGDRVGVAFAPANDAYIYIVAFDSTGWVQSLYPDPALGHRNPVPAGQEVLLPGEALYGLDAVTGVETIYILAANNPRPDIEAQMAPYLGKERPPGTGAVYRSVERPLIISRGLTDLRPASVNQAAAGETAAPDNTSLVMNSFLAANGADELAITLWFNHQ
jgi:hypothetical protein